MITEERPTPGRSSVIPAQIQQTANFSDGTETALGRTSIPSVPPRASAPSASPA